MIDEQCKAADGKLVQVTRIDEILVTGVLKVINEFIAVQTANLEYKMMYQLIPKKLSKKMMLLV